VQGAEGGRAALLSPLPSNTAQPKLEFRRSLAASLPVPPLLPCAPTGPHMDKIEPSHLLSIHTWAPQRFKGLFYRTHTAQGERGPLFREHPRLQQLRQHVGTEAADVGLQLAARRRVERLRVDERGDAFDLRLRRLRAKTPPAA
jgi:hypothetical protein